MSKFINAMRCILVVAIVSGITGLCPITAAPAIAEEISHTYTFDHPTIVPVVIDGERYDRILLQDGAGEGEPGEPALPIVGGRLLLPPNSGVISVSVETEKPISLGVGYRVEPIQFPYALSSEPSRIVAATPDASIYERNADYPEKLVESAGTFSFRGYDLAVLRMFPVVYNPVSGELLFYPRMVVTIEVENAVKANSLFRGLPVDAELAADKVDNDEEVSAYQGLSKSGMDAYSLLIITNETLKPTFATLASFHNGRGLATVVRTTAEIGSNNTDVLRDYIRNEYLTNGIEYVLLGGDDEIIPAAGFYGAVNTSSGLEVDYGIPADLFYSCLDGPMDYDGDGVYGEWGDGGPNGQSIDMIAEVFVGRASVSNTTEAQRFVAKTIRYLTTQGTYLKKSLLLGEYLGFGGISDYGGNAMDQLVGYCEDDDYVTYGMPEDTFEFDRLYDRDYAGNDWPVTELFDRINSDFHLINHDGHSNTSYALKCGSSTAIQEMKNDNLFLLYSQGCYAGSFDLGDCWAEYVNIRTDHGAFAVFMNSRFGWGSSYTTDGSSQKFQRQYWDAIYNPDENKLELGRANSDSKEDNLYLSASGSTRWVYYEMNLFGDPTIRLWDKWLGLDDFAFSDAQGDGDGIFEAGETIELRCDIENIGISSADNVTMDLTISDVTVAVNTGSVNIGSISAGEIKTNSTNPFVFTIPVDYVTRVDTFYIDISWEEEGVSHSAMLKFHTPVGAVPILLVDGNESDNVERYYLEYFNTNSIPYTLWESELLLGPSASDLSKYDIVIWFTGNFQTSPLTQSDIDAMRGFLDNGGNLFLTGQGIAASSNIIDQDFLQNYLKAEYVSSQSWPIMTAAGGMVFSPADTIGIQGAGGAYNQTFPDRVNVINGGIPEFKWFGSSVYGGLSYSGSYKLVFFTFGFEAIVNGDYRWTEREEIMGEILTFFNLEYADEAPEVTTMSIEPSEISHMVDHSPTIHWQYSDPNGFPQTAYQIQVGADFYWSPDDRWDTGPVAGTATDAAYAGLALEDGQDYCVRVRALNGQVWSPWQYEIMHYNSIPVPFDLSPADAETAYLGHIKLHCETESDIEGDVITYSYELYADAGLTELVDQIEGYGAGDKVSWSISAALVVGEDYYWRARTNDGLENGEWSETAMFIVGPEYICGDANGDQAVNIGDAVSIINYIFKGGAAPSPIQAGDANCDGSCNIGDGVSLISYIFNGGDAPCSSCPD
ncbi:MAG: C25 family cysteine peptidase [Candidatus Zixiibacteriota bacterium]